MSVRDCCQRGGLEKLTKEHQSRLPGGGNIWDLQDDEARIEQEQSFRPRVQYVSCSWRRGILLYLKYLRDEWFLWMRWTEGKRNSKWGWGSKQELNLTGTCRKGKVVGLKTKNNNKPLKRFEQSSVLITWCTYQTQSPSLLESTTCHVPTGVQSRAPEHQGWACISVPLLLALEVVSSPWASVSHLRRRILMGSSYGRY